MHGDLVFREVGGQTSGSRCSKILARQKERRVPAIVGVEETPHELAERRHVGGRIPKAGAPAGLIGPAECRSHRIHKNQIGLAEQRIGIVHPTIGRQPGGAVIRPLHPLRTQTAKLLPRGRYARRAAQEKQYRAHGGVADAVFGIEGVKEMCFRLSRCSVAQGQVADPYRIRQRFAVDRDLLVGFRGRGIGNRRCRARRRVVAVKLAGTSTGIASTSAAPGRTGWRRPASGAAVGCPAACCAAAARPARPLPPWPQAVNDMPSVITNSICPLRMYRIANRSWPNRKCAGRQPRLQNSLGFNSVPARSKTVFFRYPRRRSLRCGSRFPAMIHQAPALNLPDALFTNRELACCAMRCVQPAG